MSELYDNAMQEIERDTVRRRNEIMIDQSLVQDKILAAQLEAANLALANGGLSKRERIAFELFKNEGVLGCPNKTVALHAERAVFAADALIAALNTPTAPGEQS